MTFVHFIRGVVTVLAIGTAVGASAEPPAGITLTRRGHGWVMADAKGMTLYTTLLDQQPGKSACNEACARTWPPLVAPADSSGDLEWSTLMRADGSSQWAFRGHPLYTYSRDLKPGDSFGDDVGAQWSVAVKPIPLPAGFMIVRTVLGHVLADRAGLTLYVSDKDGADTSSCDASCARTWIPIAAPLMARDHGDWSIVRRADGAQQWAFHRKPLYRYAGEVITMTARADGRDGTWHAVVIEPPPPRPPWVTVRGSDSGELFADAAGKTLYVRNMSRRPLFSAGGANVVNAEANARDCGVECPGGTWRPVVAGADDRDEGNWSVIKRDDGRRQWAYRGEPLYLSTLDRLPGDFNGIRQADDRAFNVITRSGQAMPGAGR